MIADLLRQLFPALGRFIRYHGGRVFHRDEKPIAATASAKTTMVSGSHFDTLSDAAGLDHEYLRPVQWPWHRMDTPCREVESDELYELWTEIPGGHKWTHYFSIYQRIFASRRQEALRVLEIGVLHGASLKLWRKYFQHPKTIIVGIDISPSCAGFDAPAEGIHVRIGSQTDGAFLKQVVEDFGPFDLVIDDGSHNSSHIIASFNHLYANGLKNSGIYFVEDLHANYWMPWRDSKKSFLDVCKELLEHMHAHYRILPPAAFLIADRSHLQSAAIDVPLITTMINEIRFFDSIVVIYKTNREEVPHYELVEEEKTA